MTDHHQARLCIGLISGTSADGIDAALVRIAGAGGVATVELVCFSSTPYPAAVREELLALYDPHAPNAIARLCSVNVVVGGLFGDAALALCCEAGVSMERVHVVGSHGQTVWHQPGPEADLPHSVRSTLQIGEPAEIAERTGVPVIADFRAADIAAGGQAAPLVPYFDWVMLRDDMKSRAVQNIGGIGNVTYLPAGGGLDAVRAFDTGPGNMVIDGLVMLVTGGEQSFDRDGAMASRATVDPALLDRLLDDDYLRLAPPKTTGRERYGLAFAREVLRITGLDEGVLAADSTATAAVRQRADDAIATATAFTARTIADAYVAWLPRVDEVIVGGGGSRNPTLMGMLGAAVAPVPVATCEDHGVNSRAKEAMAFALMAHDALVGLPTNVPGATGARRVVPLGKLVPPTSRVQVAQ
ncbi:MAG: anhydro-N-acetylmuramic acid kinase [Thermomicrobiales bacterium]